MGRTADTDRDIPLGRCNGRELSSLLRASYLSAEDGIPTVETEKKVFEVAGHLDLDSDVKVAGGGEGEGPILPCTFQVSQYIETRHVLQKVFPPNSSEQGLGKLCP